MQKFSVALALLLAHVSIVAGLYVPRAAAGTQFITGPCQADGDCASDCCGFTSGKCAGAVIAQSRDGGCGFGEAKPNNRAAQVIQGPNAETPSGAAAATPAANNNGASATAAPGTTPVTKPGTQFITGVCTNDGDCASQCCGFTSGKCAGAVIAQSRDGGCGFGDAEPNNTAAQAIQGPNAEKPSGARPVASSAPAAPAANNGAAATAAPGTTPVTKPGTQFITGVCTKDGDCASQCCGFTSGKCAGAVIAQTRDGGCGFGNAQPNNDAAIAIQGPNATKPSGATAPAANNNGAAAAPAPAAPAAAPAADSKSFTLQNGKDAIALNAKFATLTADSACTDGENACVNGGFAQCVAGKFAVTGCAGGTQCFALPLVNSAGTSITCSTAADAQARIAATGAA